MMKQPEKSKRKIPLLIVVAAAVFFSFVLSFLLGERGLLELQKLQNEHEQGLIENQKLAVENKKIADEIEALRQDPNTVEKIAREELRVVAPRDTVLIVPEEEQRVMTP